MRKTIAIVLLLVLVGGGAGAWFLLAKTPPKRQAATSVPVTEIYGLQQPSFHTERPVAPADAVLPQSTPEIAEVNPAPVPERPAGMEKKLAPMRIYTSTAVPEPTPEEEDLGDYAPAFRMVRCKLVNTVDSSNIATPIQGLVTDDLVWNGKVIIARCSEVHGLAQVDKSRERIVAEGRLDVHLIRTRYWPTR